MTLLSGRVLRGVDRASRVDLEGRRADSTAVRVPFGLSFSRLT